MIITYILTAFILLTAYVVSLMVPAVGILSENVKFALWAFLAISLTVVLMRPAYSLWLSLDFWIDPWQPDEPEGPTAIR
jgi:hypothetical protein